MAENVDELVYDRVCDALRSVHAVGVGGKMYIPVFNKVVDAIACLDAGTVDRGMMNSPVFRICGEVVTRDEWWASHIVGAKHLRLEVFLPIQRP